MSLQCGGNMLGNKSATLQFMSSAMRYFDDHNKKHESRLTLYKLALIIYRVDQKRALEYTWMEPNIFLGLAEACQYETLDNLRELATGIVTTVYKAGYGEQPIPQGVIERAKLVWQEWLDYTNRTQKS